MIRRDWLNFLKVFSWAYMVAYHVSLFFGHVFPGPGIVLPIMGLGMGIGAVYTSNERRYLFRVGVCAAVSQVFWHGAGISSAWGNDLLGMTVGLMGVMVDKRVKYAGLLAVFACGCLNMAPMACTFVVLGYHLRNDLVSWGVCCAVIGAVTSYYFGWAFLSYAAAGPVVAAGRWVSFGFRGRLSRWVYLIYPGHLLGLAVARGLPGVIGPG